MPSLAANISSSLTESDIKYRLADDVVQYGEYYTLDWYIDAKTDIDSYDTYEEGWFGNLKSKTKYRCGNMYAAKADMEQEMVTSLNGNFSGYYSAICSSILSHRKSIADEFSKRMESIFRQATQKLDATKSLSNEGELSQLNTAITAIEAVL